MPVCLLESGRGRRGYHEGTNSTLGLTSWFQQSVMPRTAIEEATIWNDRAKSGMTFVFEKLVIVDVSGMFHRSFLWRKVTAYQLRGEEDEACCFEPVADSCS